MKRLVSVTLLLIGLIVAIAGVNVIAAPIGFNALIDDFRGAVVRGDAAAVQSMALEPDGAQVWETLRARNVDKAREIVMRGGGYSTSKWFGQMVGYSNFTARFPDGTSVPVRIDLIRGLIIFGQGWRIKSVTLDQ